MSTSEKLETTAYFDEENPPRCIYCNGELSKPLVPGPCRHCGVAIGGAIDPTTTLAELAHTMWKMGHNRLDAIIIPLERGEIEWADIPEEANGFGCVIMASKVAPGQGDHDKTNMRELSFCFSVKVN